jgi:23S rRNA pseudouridine2457 synthase
MIVLFNKPFNVLSQFTDNNNQSHDRKNLSNYINIPNIYPAGRLDKDSEGLLILTDQGNLQSKISHPKYKMEKTYWVQVEGEVNNESLDKLSSGVILKDGMTSKAKVKIINQPEQLWKRVPPIRERKIIPVQWLEIVISEGRNRQIRRMTASIGHPTLRLIRAKIGKWTLNNLKSGSFEII